MTANTSRLDKVFETEKIREECYDRRRLLRDELQLLTYIIVIYT